MFRVNALASHGSIFRSHLPHTQALGMDLCDQGEILRVNALASGDSVFRGHLPYLPALGMGIGA